MTEKRRKNLLTLFKIVISAALIYFIFTKINLKDVFEVVKASNPFYLFFALLLFMVSKVFNAFRLNLYFHAIAVKLNHLSNLKLYLLGMFYNLFLPGGIGGDAYKGYVIKKSFQVDTKKIIAVLLLDRLSGLLLIFVFACFLAIGLQNEATERFRFLIIGAIPLSVLAFWIVHKKLFAYVLSVFWRSFGYSILVQLLQLVSVYFILESLAIENDLLGYLFVFLISSIVSVIPLTIGGIGSREVTFLYGAKWLGLDANSSIAVSMVFFLITAIVSLSGIFYHFKKPVLKIEKSQ